MRAKRADTKIRPTLKAIVFSGREKQNEDRSLKYSTYYFL